jgi:hypothetical protein
MKKLMASAVLVVVALAAAPALAENVPVGGPDTTVSGAPSESPPGPIDEAPGEEGPEMIPPPSEEIAPPPPSEEIAPPPPSEDPVLPPPSEDLVPPPPSEDPIEDTVDTGEVPVEDTTTDDTGSGNADDAGEDTTETSNADDTAVDTGEDPSDSEDTDEQETDSGDDTVVDTGNGNHHKDKNGDDEDKNDDDEDESDDIEQDQDQEADSGDVDQSVNIINTGDNVNMCIGVLQNANTGNSQNQEGAVQDDSEAEDIELGDGSSITVTPQLVVDCRQVILQVAAAAQQADQQADRQADRKEPAKITPGAVVLKNVEPALAKTGSASVLGQPLVGQSAAVLKGLPKTGGISIGSYAVLLGLGAGSLLIAIGLLARRVLR